MTSINIDSEAYNTGFEAAIQGEARSANPYQKGTWTSENWDAGWKAAQSTIQARKALSR